MAIVVADRVKESSLTNGAGTITLNGELSGFQSFANVFSDGDQTYYCIENNVDGTYVWEVGLGTYNAGTLSRDTIFDSDNGPGVRANLNGASTIFCTYPASGAMFSNGNGELVGLFSFEDLLVSGSMTHQPYNDQGITFVRENGSNFFHAYVDNINDRTIALHSDGSESPTWKLGLKTSSTDFTEEPDHGYVYGLDGEAGLVAATNNNIAISHITGFVVTHQAGDIFKSSSLTGVHIDSNATAFPALTVNGGALLSANIQEWATSAGTVLSAVDSTGNFAIGKTTADYEIDVDGSGKFGQIYLTTGVIFPDGTTQTTASVGGGGGTDYSAAILNNTSSGVAISGWAGQTIINSGVAVSGWANGTFDTTSNTTAISGWAAQTIINSGVAVSGWADSTFGGGVSPNGASGYIQVSDGAGNLIDAGFILNANDNHIQVPDTETYAFIVSRTGIIHTTSVGGIIINNGPYNRSYGTYSIAIGNDAIASATRSVTIGNSINNAVASRVMIGANAKALLDFQKEDGVFRINDLELQNGTSSTDAAQFTVMKTWTSATDYEGLRFGSEDSHHTISSVSGTVGGIQRDLRINSNVITSGVNTFEKAIKTKIQTEVDAATITYNLNDSNTFMTTLNTDGRTLAISNAASGQKFMIRLMQDTTGSKTVNWFDNIAWAEGGTVPTLTTTASKADLFEFLCTSGTEAPGGPYVDGFVIGQDI